MRPKQPMSRKRLQLDTAPSDPVGRNRVGGRAIADGRCDRAMIRAQSRAVAESVIPGKCRRSSMTACNSPCSKNTRRIAAACASVTVNIHGPWASAGATASGAAMPAYGDLETERSVTALSALATPPPSPTQLPEQPSAPTVFVPAISPPKASHGQQ